MHNVIVGPWPNRPDRPHQQTDDLNRLMNAVLTAPNVVRFPRRPPQRRFEWLWKHSLDGASPEAQNTR